MKFIVGIAATMACLAGCSSVQDKFAYAPNEVAINTMLVPKLSCAACEGDGIPAAAQNAMISELFKRSKVTALKEAASADARIEGTITFADNQVSSGSAGAFKASSGSTSGKQVSGITILVYRRDKLIATGGYTERIVPGRVMTVEFVAARAMQSVMRQLFANGMPPRD